MIVELQLYSVIIRELYDPYYGNLFGMCVCGMVYLCVVGSAVYLCGGYVWCMHVVCSGGYV